MRVLVLTAILLGGYLYFLAHATDTVTNQLTALSNTYQYVGDHADQIAAGH